MSIRNQKIDLNFQGFRFYELPKLNTEPKSIRNMTLWKKKKHYRSACVCFFSTRSAMTQAVHLKDQHCEPREVETGTQGHTTTHWNESTPSYFTSHPTVHLLTAWLGDQDSSERYSRPKLTWVMGLLTALLCHSPRVSFPTCYLSSLPLCFITCPTLMCCTCVSLSSHSSPSFCTRSSLPQCDGSSVFSSGSSIWIPLSF